MGPGWGWDREVWRLEDKLSAWTALLVSVVMASPQTPCPIPTHWKTPKRQHFLIHFLENSGMQSVRATEDLRFSSFFDFSGVTEGQREVTCPRPQSELAIA